MTGRKMSANNMLQQQQQPSLLFPSKLGSANNMLTSRKSAESTSEVKEVTIRNTGAVSDLLFSISPARSFTIVETALEFP
jgi:hypothetical protein